MRDSRGERGAIPIAFIVALTLLAMMFLVLAGAAASGGCGNSPDDTYGETTAESSPTAVPTAAPTPDAYPSEQLKCSDDELAAKNLLSDPSAEEGLAGWSSDESWRPASEIAPCDGVYHFFAGDEEEASISQTLDLEPLGYTYDVLQEQQLVWRLRGWLASYENFGANDEGHLTVQLVDREGALIEAAASDEYNLPEWTQVDLEGPLPLGTRFVIVTFHAFRWSGTDNDAYLDNINFWIEEDVDQDGDGIGPLHGDCNDVIATVYPGAPERCNGLDDDCDDQIDEDAVGEGVYADQDGDGHGAGELIYPDCGAEEGYAATNDDCDDTDPAILPGAPEVCDGVDNNCDGQADLDAAAPPQWYSDGDGDGVGSGQLLTGCEAPSQGAVSEGGDCDDTNPAIYPGAVERCDGVDNDCDSAVDFDDSDLPADTTVWYLDSDADGYGTDADTQAECSAEYVPRGGDCDDSSDAVNPGAQEIWGNDVDEDCDGEIAAAQLYVVPGADASVEDASLFGSIQEALDAAAEGDVVAVAPGTWRENLIFPPRTVHLVSMNGPEQTVIDGSAGAGSVVTLLEGSGGSVRGFTLTGGRGSDGSICGLSAGFSYGGALCARGASPIIEGNIVTGNRVTGSGGAMFIEQGAADVVGNLFTLNEASYDGGALNLSDFEGVVSDNVFEENIAGRSGGALVVHNSPCVVRRNLVRSNVALAQLFPGGVLVPSGGGGAIVTGAQDPLFQSNLWVFNSSAYNGGGVQISLQEGSAAAVNLLNETFAANVTTGGSGGAIFIGEGTASLDSVLMSDNGAPAGANLSAEEDAAASLAYSLAWSAEGGAGVLGASTEGVIVADPLFVSPADASDPEAADLHPGAGSPAIDAGNPSSAQNDRDGSRNDIGAYGGPESL